jgi:hypothetical protein
LLVAVVAGLALACSSGGGGNKTSGGGPRSLAGTVTYDFVPALYNPSTHAGGLNFAGAIRKPVRAATVQVMKGSTVLATTNTDASGHYALSFTEPAGSDTLAVVAIAESTGPVIHVVDNTDGKATWAIGAAVGATATTQDLHAAHGWTGTAYDPAARTAAPFAILDSMYTAARAFLAVRSVAFPELVVNWSPDNTPAAGQLTLGQIGTSHFSPSENQIYVLGKQGIDADEFDAHVIVHEWAHYFEHTSRAPTARADLTPSATSSTRASPSARATATPWPPCCCPSRSTRTRCGAAGTSSRSASTPRRSRRRRTTPTRARSPRCPSCGSFTTSSTPRPARRSTG